MYAFSLFVTLHRPRVGTILIHSADSPGFPCLATEIIWCCQGIFMKAMEVNNLLLASRRFLLDFFCSSPIEIISSTNTSDSFAYQRTRIIRSDFYPTGNTCDPPPKTPTFDGKKQNISYLLQDVSKCKNFLPRVGKRNNYQVLEDYHTCKSFQIGSLT